MYKLILPILLLSACSSIPKGLTITDKDKVTCETQECSVWSLEELNNLLKYGFMKGYEAGKSSI